MLPEVKRCADSNDIKGLRYIFVDCLDVDPTFEKYKEDYEYCKHIPGFFEDYTEISTLTDNQSMWNEKYWEVLKTELLKNFSEKRFQHMIKVAKVIYAEKIEKLIKERRRIEEERKKLERENKEFEEKQAREAREEKRRKLQEYSVKKANNAYENNNEVQKISKEQKENERIEARKKEIERENKEIEEKIARKEKEKEERKKATNNGGMRNERTADDMVHRNHSTTIDEPKKFKGVVPIAILVIIIIIIILLIAVLK